jgi:hypothetical protein
MFGRLAGEARLVGMKHKFSSHSIEPSLEVIKTGPNLFCVDGHPLCFYRLPGDRFQGIHPSDEMSERIAEIRSAVEMLEVTQ